MVLVDSGPRIPKQIVAAPIIMEVCTIPSRRVNRGHAVAVVDTGNLTVFIFFAQIDESSVSYKLWVSWMDLQIPDSQIFSRDT